MSSVYLRAPLPRCLSPSLARVGIAQANCHHPAPKLLASRVSQVRTGTSFRPRKLHAATAGQPHAPHHRQPLPPAFATAPIPHHQGSSWQKPKRHTACTRTAPSALVTQLLSPAPNHTPCGNQLYDHLPSQAEPSSKFTTAIKRSSMLICTRLGPLTILT